MIRLKGLAAAIASSLLAIGALAQTSPPPSPTPSPGPTAPPPPLPIPKKGDDLVINPTEEECKKGWHSALRWTKEEFERFCDQLKISK
jgi:hypothetical protein